MDEQKNFFTQDPLIGNDDIHDDVPYTEIPNENIQQNTPDDSDSGEEPDIDIPIDGIGDDTAGSSGGGSNNTGDTPRGKYIFSEERAGVMAKSISSLFCNYFPEVFRSFAYIDKYKLNRIAIKEKLNLDIKLKIGEDTIIPFREYIDIHNERVSESIKFPEELKPIIEDSVSELLQQQGINATPGQRIVGSLLLASVIMGINTYIISTEKREIINILRDYKESEKKAEKVKKEHDNQIIDELRRENERLKNIIEEIRENAYQNNSNHTTKNNGVKKEEADPTILGEDIETTQAEVIEDDDKNGKKNNKGISIDDINEALNF